MLQHDIDFRGGREKLNFGCSTAGLGAVYREADLFPALGRREAASPEHDPAGVLNRWLGLLDNREFRSAREGCPIEEYFHPMLATVQLRRYELQSVVRSHLEGHRVVTDGAAQLTGSGLGGIETDLVGGIEFEPSNVVANSSPSTDHPEIPRVDDLRMPGRAWQLLARADNPDVEYSDLCRRVRNVPRSRIGSSFDARFRHAVRTVDLRNRNAR